MWPPPNGPSLWPGGVCSPESHVTTAAQVEVGRGFGELDMLQNDVRRALAVVEVVDELGDTRLVGSRFGAGQEDTLTL